MMFAWDFVVPSITENGGSGGRSSSVDVEA